MSAVYPESGEVWYLEGTGIAAVVLAFKRGITIPKNAITVLDRHLIQSTVSWLEHNNNERLWRVTIEERFPCLEAWAWLSHHEQTPHVYTVDRRFCADIGLVQAYGRTASEAIQSLAKAMGWKGAE